MSASQATSSGASMSIGAGEPVRTALLLAAGRGTRLKPHTDTTPKPMLPWKGRPTLDHLLDALLDAGINDIVLVVNHLAEQIESWAEQRCTDGLTLRCVRQAGFGGTADAVQSALVCLPGAPVLLTATDYLVEPPFYREFLEFHAAHDACASVSMKHLPEQELAARSSVRFAGVGVPTGSDAPEVLEIVEKPQPGCAPSAIGANLIFVLPPVVFARIEEVPVSARGEREVQSALNAWLAAGGSCRGLIQGSPDEWQPES